MRGLCAVTGCGRAMEDRQWCHGHYEFWRRNGVEPSKPFLSTMEDRFWAKVDKAGPGGCWLWTGATDGRKRYGSIWRDGRVQRAHRVAYELLVGPVAPGLDLDHLCRVTLCVNPAHLEPVTHRTNVLRGLNFTAVNAAKTECIRGHDLTDPANVYRVGAGLRGRSCRPCRRDRRLERLAAELAEPEVATS